MRRELTSRAIRCRDLRIASGVTGQRFLDGPLQQRRQHFQELEVAGP
jgi:hypothetical protein